MVEWLAHLFSAQGKAATLNSTQINTEHVNRSTGRNIGKTFLYVA